MGIQKNNVAFVCIISLKYTKLSHLDFKKTTDFSTTRLRYFWSFVIRNFCFAEGV